MAAPTKKERILADRVRNLELDIIEKYLLDDSPENKKFKQDLILKLATNILPRKVEMGGEDGKPIRLQVTGMKIIKE